MMNLYLMILQLLVLHMMLLIGCEGSHPGPCDINFLSFFPCINDSATGTSVRECDVFLYPAALLAVEHINAHPHYLKYPQYGFNDSLHLLEVGTKGDVHFSMFFYTEQLNPKLPPIHAILGPDSSDIAARVAYFSGQKYQTHMMSYGATDPSLSDRERYPLLFSTIPSERFTNVGRLQLLRMFNWHRVGMLSSTEPVYAKAAESFVRLADNYPDMSITYYGSFGDTPVFAFDEMWDADMRIILGLFSEKRARSVLCKAHRYRDGKLTDAHHMWILPSYYDPQWWNTSDEKLNQLPFAEQCSNKEMIDILRSVLFVGSFNWNQQTTETTSGKNTAEFFDQLLRKTVEVFPSLRGENLAPYLLHSHAATTYDAAWSMALAWHSAIPELVFKPNLDICSRTNPTYANQITMKVLSASVNNTTLHGISGDHEFNRSWDSQGQIVVSQFINGTHWPIGMYQIEDRSAGVENLTLLYLADHLSQELKMRFTPATGFQWKGLEPPSDGVIIVHSSIPTISVGVVSTLILLSLTYAIILLVLNFKWRRNKHIKASSPKLNWIIIIGCMSIMPYAIVPAIEFSSRSYGIADSVASTTCKVSVIGEYLGTIVTLSTLLAKNWRIYKIFHNSKQRNLDTLSDERLIILILVSTLPTIILLSLLIALDPPRITEQHLPECQTLILIVTFCSSKNSDVWKGLRLMISAPVILAIMFLSFQNSRITSHRFVEEGNSATRAILTLVLFIVLIIFAAMIESQPQFFTTTFWLNTVWLLGLPDLLLTVLYMPKFAAMYSDYRRRRKQKADEGLVSVLKSHYSFLNKEKKRLRHELVEKKEEITTLMRSREQSLVDIRPNTSTTNIVANIYGLTAEIPRDFSEETDSSNHGSGVSYTIIIVEA